MAQTVETVCGLDIRKESICLAQYLPQSNAITSVVINPLEDQSDTWWESMGPELTRLVSEIKFQGLDTISSLPAEWAVLEKLMVDSAETDVDTILEWEMSQQILGSLGDYVCDFHRLNLQFSDNFHHYIGVGYRKEIVNGLSAMTKASKLHPVVVDLDLFALINLFEINYPESISQPALILHAEMEKSKLVLTCNGTFIDYEVLALPFDPESLKTYVDAVRNSVQRLAQINPVQSGETPLFCTGPIFGEPEVGDQICSTLPGSQILNPFKNVAFHVERVSDDDLKKYAPHLSVAVGLAVRGGIDL